MKVENNVIEKKPINDLTSDVESEETIEGINPELLGMTQKDFDEILGKKANQEKKEKEKKIKKEQPKDEKSKESKTNPMAEKDALDDLLKDELVDESEKEDESSDEESEDLEAEDEAEKEDSETEESEDDLIEILHDNQKIKLPMDEIKSLAQKGYDYTKKTQALADEKKSFAAEKAELEREVNDLVKSIHEEDAKKNASSENYKNFDIAIDLMKEDGMNEVLETLAQYVSKASRLTKNPIVDSKVQGLQSELESIKKELQGQKHQAKLSTFYAEMADVEKSEAGKKLLSIGLKIDKDAVKDAWSSSDKLSVRQAIQAVYGEQIASLIASKNNVARSQQTKKTIGQIKQVAGRNAPAKSAGKIDISRMSDNQILDAIRDGKIDVNEI